MTFAVEQVDPAAQSPRALRAAVDELRAVPLLVALDFDGTMSEIVAHPAMAKPVPGALAVVQGLTASCGVTVALVSGRPVADLRQVSGVGAGVVLIGSHGAQWEGRQQLAISAEQTAALKRTREAVRALVAATPGAMLEPKPAGFAVHVRHASPRSGQFVVSQVAELADAADLHTLTGKSVIDVGVHPLDKGAAIAVLRAELGDPTLLFAGDDVTDETVMSVARGTDLTIRVGAGETSARFRVPDPQALVAVLTRLAEVRAQ